MADRSPIEWTDATWNAMRGCSRTIAAGAETSGCGDPTGGGCYAERNGYRFAGPGLPYEGLVRMTPSGARWTGKVLLVDKHLLDPIRWERHQLIEPPKKREPGSKERRLYNITDDGLKALAASPHLAEAQRKLDERKQGRPWQ